VPFNTNHKIQIVDASGDPCDDNDGRLKILLEAADLNIGNVDILSVPAPLNVVGAGTEASALRVTLANNSSGVITVDGTVGVNVISGFATSDGQLANNHNVVVTSAPTTAVTGTFFQGTQPISGTVTANAGSGTLAVSLASVPSHAVTNAGTFAVQAGHNITGGADGVTTDDTSGTVLGADVGCKKIDIQAQTDNTGLIAVGFTGVDATVATGTGILLNAGDIYSLEINNLNLIYIESSVSGEGVRYTYFT
tara:strand:- start:1665 stop:2417 length:753 start_codon:yes stop_codon:yes gene_type:complete